MKKLILIALAIAFAAACANPSLEENYEKENINIQAIDHSEVGEEDHPEELKEGDPDRNSN